MGTYRSNYILVAGGLCVDANWNAKIATADFSVAQIIYGERKRWHDLGVFLS